MTDPRGRVEKLRRRSLSLSVLAIATTAITMSIPIWVPVTIVVDLVRLRRRFPLVRLGAMAACWSWIECVGVVRAFGLWVRGRGGDQDANYALMSWWAGALMAAMRTTTGRDPRIEGADQLVAGDAIVLSRHASFGDSLLSGWALATELRLQPRYVLKKELLFDPCLDIVGLRVPNHFLDREASDGSVELNAIREMARGIGPGVVGVIFAEGTRSNDAKRERALEKIAEREPDRAARLAHLRRLLPPRPAGSMAMLAGAPDADVVLVWHTGFDGLDSLSGMLRQVSRGLTEMRFVARRVPRAEVPDGDAFVSWLDEQWLAMDADVDAALAAR
ncbi:1-acyl-sn-glycerol-3-phosphate acyltransferase [Ilumatobacter sp.]|uniref:1-acyl-sn-glycerol-3-phosphate acyltransferase n=1 Tax=Ilumatobacter sp. TaxID=1967498 RepID=UPI003AF758F2